MNMFKHVHQDNTALTDIDLVTEDGVIKLVS